MINNQLTDDHKRDRGTVTVPKQDTFDMYHVCERNTERNSIKTSIFRDYNIQTHPNNESNVDLTDFPKNTVVIESAIYDMNKERCSAALESKVYNTCGDADDMTSRNKYIIKGRGYMKED